MLKLKQKIKQRLDIEIIIERLRRLEIKEVIAEQKVRELTETIDDLKKCCANQNISLNRRCDNLLALSDLLITNINNSKNNIEDHTSDELIIVTAADSSHFKPLLRFLFSVETHEGCVPVIIYDLGLTPDERESFQILFPAYELRTFNYSEYPDYFDIKVRAGEYAWKPVVIHEVANEQNGLVVWMDAGNLITEPMISLRQIINDRGFYTPQSGGTVRDWTHRGTLEYLSVPDHVLSKKNRACGLVGFDTRRKSAMTLIEVWSDCALNKNCIAPEGSSRRNHRQDQAVLTVLLYQSEFADCPLELVDNIRFHQD
ncbi:MAG: DUF1647 domain-containing protein [Gammaproteobacteria bacterium]|nr:DUF1647 domain-containing protein [Gammaproteobacteria bacterium]